MLAVPDPRFAEVNSHLANLPRSAAPVQWPAHSHMGYPSRRAESKGRGAEDEVVDVVDKQFIQEFMKRVYKGDLKVMHRGGHIYFQSAHSAAAQDDQAFGAAGEGLQYGQCLKPRDGPEHGRIGAGVAFGPISHVPAEVIQDAQVQ